MMASKTIFCPTCDGMREVKVEERQETYPVRGEDITVVANVAVCMQCDADVWDNELDDANLERAYDAYREKYRIPTTKELKALRKKYGLSQRAFARLLGWGEATISRYEAGALPDLGQSLVLRLVHDFRILERYLELNGSALTPSEKAKVDKSISQIALQSLKMSLAEQRTAARDQKDKLKQRVYLGGARNVSTSSEPEVVDNALSPSYIAHLIWGKEPILKHSPDMAMSGWAEQAKEVATQSWIH